MPPKVLNMEALGMPYVCLKPRLVLEMKAGAT